MSAPSPVRAHSTVPPAHTLTLAITVIAFATAVVVTTEFIAVGLLPAMARGLQISRVEAAHFVTWFALSAAVLGPFVTVAATRAQPRCVLTAALLVFALGNLVVALVPHYAVIVAIRVVQGAALPVFISIANAALAQLAGAGQKGGAIARVNVGTVVASVLGLPVGVALAHRFDWPAAFVGLAALAVIAAAAVGLTFPDVGRAKSKSLGAQTKIVGQFTFQAHLLLSAMLFTAMFVAYTYLAAFLETVAGLDGRGIAFALIGFGVAGLIGNWMAGRVVDRAPTATTAGVAFASILAMTALSLVGGRLALLLPLLGFWGAAHNAAFVACQMRVMSASSRAPAFALSLNMSACNLGIAFGSVVGGWVVQRQGIEAVGFAGAAIAACALVVALLLRRLSAIHHDDPSTGGN
jgi:DHA1 family inner membrane transport protein